MKIYEGTLKLFLLKDVFNNNYQEKISAVIDKSFTVTEEMKDFHKRREQKGYVFNGFFDKNAKNKDYKYPAGNVYSVRIRSISEDLMIFFKNNLSKVRTEEIQALTFEYRTLPDTVIKTIYSITPCVCKFEKGYWQKSNNTIDDVIERVEKNARKKLAMLNEEVPEDIDFIISYKKLNDYAIVREYNKKDSKDGDRKIKLLCDKFEFEISPNESSQKLAKAIIGAGLLEMNARGFGYVNVKTI